MFLSLDEKRSLEMQFSKSVSLYVVVQIMYFLRSKSPLQPTLQIKNCNYVKIAKKLIETLSEK